MTLGAAWQSPTINPIVQVLERSVRDQPDAVALVAEVEQVLAAYQPVLEAAVIGVPSERWGETVKALVVARPGHLVRSEDVIAFTRARLAACKCPTSVDVVEELPHTPTGKVRKDVLRKPYWHGRDRRVS